MVIGSSHIQPQQIVVPRREWRMWSIERHGYGKDCRILLLFFFDIVCIEMMDRIDCLESYNRMVTTSFVCSFVPIPPVVYDSVRGWHKIFLYGFYILIIMILQNSRIYIQIWFPDINQLCFSLYEYECIYMYIYLYRNRVLGICQGQPQHSTNNHTTSWYVWASNFFELKSCEIMNHDSWSPGG